MVNSWCNVRVCGSFEMFHVQDEVVIPTSRGTLIVKPAQSSWSPERSAAAKTVQFTVEDELVEVETGKKQTKRRSSLIGLLRRSRKDSADDEIEELDQIKFRELLALNLPDWYLVLLGVICAGLLGALFPLMAIIFSGFLEVGEGLGLYMCVHMDRPSFPLYTFL